MAKCWICGREYEGECPECSAELPWGPTAEDLADDDKTERDDTDYSDDNDTARDVCVPRHGPI